MVTRFDEPHFCLNCSRGLNVVAGFGHNKKTPRTGDLTICLHCAALMVFTDSDGSVREAIQADLEGIDIATLLSISIMQQTRRTIVKHKRAVERHERN